MLRELLRELLNTLRRKLDKDEPSTDDRQQPFVVEQEGNDSGTTNYSSVSTTRVLSVPSEALRVDSKSRLALSNNPWLVEAELLEYKKKIGAGAYGEVFLGKLLDMPVAIKRLHSDDVVGRRGSGLSASSFGSGGERPPDRRTRALSREIQLLTKIRNPYIVMFLGVCLDPLACITEYCCHGSLYKTLEKAATDGSLALRLTWVQRVKMMLNTALGMQHLHSLGLVHRDIKSGNLMVDEALRVKVGDFGLSVLEINAPSAVSTVRNISRRWLAPEVAVSLVTEDDSCLGASPSTCLATGSDLGASSGTGPFAPSGSTAGLEPSSSTGGLAPTSSESLGAHAGQQEDEEAEALQQQPWQGRPQPFTKASDVYSFGLVMLELATFKIPFHTETEDQVFLRACMGNLKPKVPSAADIVGSSEAGELLVPYLQLMQQCWAEDPADRPDFRTIVRMLRGLLKRAKDSRQGSRSASTALSDL